MKRILFTGVGRRVELIQAFRRAALVLKKEVAIFGADLDETAPALVYCDSIRKVAAMENEQSSPPWCLPHCSAQDLPLPPK